jgi:hypothetical protein
VRALSGHALAAKPSQLFPCSPSTQGKKKKKKKKKQMNKINRTCIEADVKQKNIYIGQSALTGGGNQGIKKRRSFCAAIVTFQGRQTMARRRLRAKSKD